MSGRVGYLAERSGAGLISERMLSGGEHLAMPPVGTVALTEGKQTPLWGNSAGSA